MRLARSTFFAEKRPVSSSTGHRDFVGFAWAFFLHSNPNAGAPQPLDEDVVPSSPFAVHADRNAVVGEHAGEGRACELRTLTLVRIEDFRAGACLWV